MLSRVLLVSALALLCASSLCESRPLSRRVATHRGALNRRLPLKQVAQPNDAPAQWFAQTLDHSDLSSSSTFQQLYYVNNTMFNPSNPIVFLTIGGEGPISPAYVADHFVTGQLAQSFGAMMVAVEHRFYGQSVPNGDSSTANLKYLSSAQALEDLVTIRGAITAQYNLPSNTQWVTFGGSYSGSLSAWARSKYPNLFVGAFATSAPVQAILDYHQYMEVVSQSLGPKCSAAVMASTHSLITLLSNASGQAQLQQQFNLCTAPSLSNKFDAANFLETVSDPISGIVQYNLDNNAYEMYDVPTLCGKLLAAPTPLQGLLTVWNDYNTFTGNTECTDIVYTNMVKDMQATSDARSWTWQTCTEFGYFQSAETPAQPFSSLISLDWFVQQCADIYGIAGLTPRIDYINAYYGGNQIVTSNTAFVNGNIDPWHVLGNYQNYSPQSQSATVLVQGTAHCADLYPPRSSDLPGLTQARAVQKALLAEWLKNGNPTTVAAPAPAAAAAPVARKRIVLHE